MKKVKIITLFLFLFASSSSFALTPPLSPGELLEDADLVIEGEVTGEVACIGKTLENKCFNRIDYKTEITPSKIIKGKTKKKKAIEVHFFHNDYSKSKCTGDQGASLHQGDIGTFYLKKSDKGYYYPFHWTAVEIKTSGSGSWPSCK